MIARVFALDAFLIAGGFALGGFTIGLILGLVKGEGGRAAALRGLESAVLALVGGFISRFFISGLLAAGGNTPGTGLAIGWAFFLWPGGVDTIVKLATGSPLLTTPAALLILASLVGSAAGMMDGLRRIHRWKGAGVITFLSDITWGLAGTTNGCLFHLVNFLWASHRDEARHGAHSYQSGFRFMPDYAVTQGSVMSNMGGNGPDSSLFRHESIHVLQNRIFGPFFTLTYLGWMAVLALPALIAGLIMREVGVFKSMMWWCYYDCPWEVWAYGVANPGSRQDPRGVLCWSLPLAVIMTVVILAPTMGLSALLVAHVWF